MSVSGYAFTGTSEYAYQIRPDAKRFETWDCYVAGRIGLGVAVDYALGIGIERTWPMIRQLAATLRAELGKIPGVTVHDHGIERCGIVTFVKDGTDPQAMQQRSRSWGMNTSVSSSAYSLLDMVPRWCPDGMRYAAWL